MHIITKKFLNNDKCAMVVDLIFKSNAICLQETKLHSGLISPIYIDCRKIISYVENRALLISIWNEIIQEIKPDAIIGGATAGIPFATLIAQHTSLPCGYIRKQSKTYGKQLQLEGCANHIKGNILFVEDVLTTGKSLKEFIQILNSNNMSIQYATCIISYYPYDSKIKIENAKNIITSPLCTICDIINYMQHNKYDCAYIKKIQNFIEHSKDESA